jgi:hypothetical protein
MTVSEALHGRFFPQWVKRYPEFLTNWFQKIALKVSPGGIWTHDYYFHTGEGALTAWAIKGLGFEPCEVIIHA